MKEKKSKRKSGSTPARVKALLLAAAMTLGLVTAPAYAATGTETQSGKGTLTIEVAAHDSYTKTDTSISGVEVTLEKIASLEKSTNTYTLDSSFKDAEDAYRNRYEEEYGKASKNIFDGMNVEQSNYLAAEIVSRYEGKLEGALVDTTKSDGKVTFSGLTDGMYLVFQSGASGMATKYTEFSPYLVSVPNGTEKEDKTVDWEYNVVLDPKTAPSLKPTTPPDNPPYNPPSTPTPTETPTPTPTETPTPTVPDNNKGKGNGKTNTHVTPTPKPPITPSRIVQQVVQAVKTGDTNTLFTYAGLVVLSAIVIFGVVRKRKKD